MPYEKRIRVTVNGVCHERSVEPRLLLSDFLRQTLNLTGTHVGCEQGICGACTVLIDGDSVRSCLTLAVQGDNAEIRTVEGHGSGSRAERNPSHAAGAAFRTSEAPTGQSAAPTPGLHRRAESMSPLQRAFKRCHALQCGFCTPGFLATIEDMLNKYPLDNEDRIRELLSGNLCRCTGYQNIVDAVIAARDDLAQTAHPRDRQTKQE